MRMSIEQLAAHLGFGPWFVPGANGTWSYVLSDITTVAHFSWDKDDQRIEVDVQERSAESGEVTSLIRLTGAVVGAASVEIEIEDHLDSAMDGDVIGSLRRLREQMTMIRDGAA
jgi:hypothetical protein